MFQKKATLIAVLVGLSLTGTQAVATAALPDQAIRAAASLVAQAGQEALPASPSAHRGATADQSDLPGATGLPEAALTKLSQEQLYRLAQRKIDGDAMANSSLDEPIAAVVVPTATFLMIVLIVWLVVAFRAKKTRLIHETLRLMVEKGADIPTELIAPRPKANVDLRRGVLLVFGGIGYMLFMGLLAAFEPDALNGLGVGLVPFFVGIGYLLVWRIEKRQTDAS